MLGARSSGWLALFAMLPMAGCNGPTQLVVVVDTDFEVPAELNALRVEVTGPSGTTRDTMQALDAESELPMTVTVVPLGEELGPVEVRAVGELNGALVVAQNATVTLEAGRSLTLRLFLGRVCSGVSCPTGQTCACGDCTASARMAGEWSGSPTAGDPCLETADAGLGQDGAPGDATVGCTADAECDDSIDCTSDRCAAGICENTPNDGACTAGTGGGCIAGFGCQYDGCSPSTCVAGPCQAARCEGDSCILQSACASDQECCGGACVPTGCDDSDACTDDACGASGCENTPNTATCDDAVFCNGADTCSGGSCSGHAGDPCSGASVCNETMGSCVGCAVDGDCPDPIPGPWSSCSYSSSCDESGTRDRTVTSYTCVSGTCQPSATTEDGTCSRSTSGDSCGSTTFGTWGSCGAYADACDESGTRDRTRTDRECSGGTCSDVNSTDTGSCLRDTDGDSCGTTSYGTWGGCGGFANSCDESGTRSRSETTYTCGLGTCQTSSGTDSESCSRDTDGDSCGTTTYGTWGGCGGYGSICGENGTRSRPATSYSCSAGSCDTIVGTDSEPCVRNTDGNSCDDFASCRRGSCSGGSCNLTGSGCSPLMTCCEPGICVPNGSFCP